MKLNKFGVKVKKAFTMVEILVVVVIIGILMMALMGGGVFFSADSTVQNKLQATSESWRKCIQDLDTVGVSIDDAKNILGGLLVDNDSPDENGNALSDKRTVSKGKTIDGNNGYQVTQFYENIKNLVGASDIDRTICQDFIANYVQDVSQKWTTVNWYIPSAVQGDDIFSYLDTDFGGFLVCATHKSRKYAYFEDANKKNKFYTCSILGLNGDNAGTKIRVLQAFGGDGKKIIKTDSTTPEIPTN